MRDFKAAVRDAIAPLLAAALAEGPNAVMGLMAGMAETGLQVTTARAEMLVSPVFHCNACQKHWTITIPLKQCRDVQPFNCPTCFNAELATRPEEKRFGMTESGWTAVFSYCEGPEHDP